MPETQPKINFWQSLTKQQRRGLVLLVVFTCLILIFWFWQLKKNLIYPLYGGYNPSDIAQNSGSSQTDLNLNDEQMAKIYQQSQDTDQDGLNDWEELNIYGTSPYLADSDGDGISDFDEIKAGENPNCPQGQQCVENNLLTDQSGSGNLSPSTSTIIPDLSQDSGQNSGVSADDANILKQVFGENPDAATIRLLLLQAGTSQEELDKVSDEELVKIYQEMINQK